MEINPLNNQQQYNCKAENHNAQTKDVNFGAQTQRGTSSQNSISNSQISAATRAKYVGNVSNPFSDQDLHVLSAKIDTNGLNFIGFNKTNKRLCSTSVGIFNYENRNPDITILSLNKFLNLMKNVKIFNSKKHPQNASKYEESYNSLKNHIKKNS